VGTRFPFLGRKERRKTDDVSDSGDKLQEKGGRFLLDVASTSLVDKKERSKRPPQHVKNTSNWVM